MAIGAQAQPKGRLPRIGWLYSTAIKAGARLEQGFLLGLREQGYIEGRNVLIERRWADGRSERIPALAAELVDLKVDVIYAPTPPDAFAAWQATRSIPIVFAYMGDPVGTGVAKSLARPGGNVTGLSSVNTDLATKRYALLMEIEPKMARVATLYDPGVHENLQYLEASRDAAKELGITIISVPVRRVEDFAAAFDTVKKSSVDAMLVIANPLFYSHRRRFTELAAETGLPAMYGRVEFVEDGGLIGYSIDGADQARRAAGYVARILPRRPPKFLHLWPLQIPPPNRVATS